MLMPCFILNKTKTRQHNPCRHKRGRQNHATSRRNKGKTRHVQFASSISVSTQGFSVMRYKIVTVMCGSRNTCFVFLCLESGDMVSHGKSASCHGHVFHHECLSQWLDTHSTCPCCRRDLQKIVDEPSPSILPWQRETDAAFCLFVF